MEEKIALLTQQLYHDGIIKAKEEAVIIKANAENEANTLLEKAKLDAVTIVEKAKSVAEELRKNTEEEIKAAGTQALALVKQSIADTLTMDVAKDLVSSDVKLSSPELIQYAVDKMINLSGSDQINLILPESLENDLKSHIESVMHKHFKGQISVNVSQKIDSGFRIGPASKNYIISFTEEDFIRFFSHLVRPKTAEILFG